MDYDQANSIFNLHQHSDLNSLAKSLKDTYINASPYPHIIIDNAINLELISAIETSFPELNDDINDKFDNIREKKFASHRGDSLQTHSIKKLFSHLNSSQFLDFLQELTSIKEALIPDPHFIGGGMHQIQRGGFLKIHADFCKHEETKLDRRLNLLLYLNKDWEEVYGGHLELWDSTMQNCHQRILPIFNRMVIFNTTDYTFHGHPNPLECPPERSRKSLAMYYYSNGRPLDEIRTASTNQGTLFKSRPGESLFIINDLKPSLIYWTKQIMPPILLCFQRS